LVGVVELDSLWEKYESSQSSGLGWSRWELVVKVVES
jgi:hypothetical protein